MTKNVQIIKRIEMSDISNASGKKKPTRFVTNVSPNNTSPTTPLSDITNVNASSSSNALKTSSHSTLQTISHKVHSPSSSNALKTPSSQTMQRNSHKENSFFIPPNCRVAQKFTELPPDFSNNQDTIQHNTTHSTTTKRKQFNTQDIPFFELNEDFVEPSDYLDSGDAVYVCSVCKAKVWQGEAIRGNKDLKKTCYSICCYNGKVELPSLIHPPQLLLDLYSGLSEKSQNFIQNIRRYNMMFAFTSMAGKIDHTVNSGGGPYVYRMHGQNYHIAGSLLPEEGESPRFCQLYMYDTDHEVQNRFKSCESNKKKKTTSNESMANPFSLEFWTIHELMGLLDFINPLAKQFRMARDRFGSNPTERIRLKLIGSRENDGRQYNLPTTNEVAALIIGDIDGYDSRDIVLETQSRQLQRINELHPQYLALQYPLLFPYAEDGFRVDILHRGVEDPESDGRIRLTMREFFAYRIQQRTDEISLILRSRKLFQQFWLIRIQWLKMNDLVILGLTSQHYAWHLIATWPRQLKMALKMLL
ncbi:unnamed protein product [Lactuca virosa]|uniref:Helitron helicase-like domain-containing protein n=1 Tax=Lactuca virosa TaxID=75947 RepID=A0AAU9P4W7_9ASTR|nr:unnamed protein product [Lactuca virosa]